MTLSLFVYYKKWNVFKRDISYGCKMYYWLVEQYAHDRFFQNLQLFVYYMNIIGDTKSWLIHTNIFSVYNTCRSALDPI